MSTAGDNNGHDTATLTSLPPVDHSDKITVTVTEPRTAPAAHNAGSVCLRGISVALDTEIGAAFVTDCARHLEGSLSDTEVKTKWGLSVEDWSNLASNKPLLDAVQAERERRIFSNEAAREAAQRHLVMAPAVLNEILTDEQVAPRHRIDAARELRQTAGGGPKNAGQKEKVVINIDLGADCKIHHEFELAVPVSSQADDEEQ